MSELKRNIWGPALWTFLHTAAATLDNPDSFTQIVLALPQTLPCPECRQHTIEFLQQNNPQANIRDAVSASRFVFEFHNAVNLRLGKPVIDARQLQIKYGILLPEATVVTRRYERVRPYRMI